jgi:hypothetical protein
MSGMETAAEPLLTAMFNARRSSVRLDDAAQLVLARWAFKTAAVAAQVDGSDPFPLAHRREFHETDLPPRHAQVRIGTSSIPALPMGEQLAESRFEPKTATITRAGQATGPAQGGPARNGRDQPPAGPGKPLQLSARRAL